MARTKVNIGAGLLYRVNVLQTAERSFVEVRI